MTSHFVRDWVVSAFIPQVYFGGGVQDQVAHLLRLLLGQLPLVGVGVGQRRRNARAPAICIPQRLDLHALLFEVGSNLLEHLVSVRSFQGR